MSAVHNAVEDFSELPGHWRGSPFEASIAISLKRIADMMEEDRKPHLSLAPEGWVSDDEHRRILREGLAEEVLIWKRIASAIEAATAGETTQIGSTEGESAVPSEASADAQPSSNDSERQS